MRKNRSVLELEHLEARCVPSTFYYWGKQVNPLSGDTMEQATWTDGNGNYRIGPPGPNDRAVIDPRYFYNNGGAGYVGPTLLSGATDQIGALDFAAAANSATGNLTVHEYVGNPSILKITGNAGNSTWAGGQVTLDGYKSTSTQNWCMLVIDGGTVSWQNTIFVNNGGNAGEYGILKVDSGATLNSDSPVIASQITGDAIYVYGTLNLDANKDGINGMNDALDGYTIGPTVFSTGTINFLGGNTGSLYGNCFIDNYGVVDVQTSKPTINDGVKNESGGYFEVNRAQAVDIPNALPIFNDGHTTSFYNFGRLAVFDQGSLYADSGFLQESSGSVSASDSINYTATALISASSNGIDFEGGSIILPEGNYSDWATLTLDTPQQVTFNGNLTVSLGIDGPVQGVESQITSDAGLVFGGSNNTTLSVNVALGAAGPAGKQWSILYFASMTGAFSTSNWANTPTNRLGGASWYAAISYNAGILAVVTLSKR